MHRYLALLLPVVTACTDQVPSSTALVRDSAGIRIVENMTPQWQDGEAWRLNPEPVVNIGGGDAEEDRLFRVVAAFRFTDGRIAVATSSRN